MHLHHSESIVYIRVHNWCSFCGRGLAFRAFWGQGGSQQQAEDRRSRMLISGRQDMVRWEGQWLHPLRLPWRNTKDQAETRKRLGRDPGDTWQLMNDRHWFLTALEAGCPRSACQQSLFTVRTCFLVHRWHLLTVSSPGGRGEGALWGLHYKDADSTLEALSSWSHHLPEEPLLTPSCWGLGFNIWIWEGLRQSVAEKY